MPGTSATFAYLFRPAHTDSFLLVVFTSEHPFWMLPSTIIWLGHFCIRTTAHVQWCRQPECLFMLLVVLLVAVAVVIVAVVDVTVLVILVLVLAVAVALLPDVADAANAADVVLA
jgi:succinate-acetate transporter protein